MSRVRIAPASDLELDDERGDAYWKGQHLELSPESYRVLRLVACNPNKTYTASEIVDAAELSSDAEHTEVQRQFQLIKRAFSAIKLGYYPIRVVLRQGYNWDETPPQPKRSIIARLFKWQS